jgi:hypothetical protein
MQARYDMIMAHQNKSFIKKLEAVKKLQHVNKQQNIFIIFLRV